MRKDLGERKKKIMGILMGIVMFGSLFTFVFFGFSGSSTGRITHNGFEFINRGTHWSTEVGGIPAFFTYFPSDLGFIFVDLDVINSLKNAVQIDFTSEFNDTASQSISLAAFNMDLTLKNFNVFVRQGFTTQQQNFLVIKCEEATNFVPVIYFKSSNITKVDLNNNCITVEASTPQDFERIKDRLVYGILGII